MSRNLGLEAATQTYGEFEAKARTFGVQPITSLPEHLQDGLSGVGVWGATNIGRLGSVLDSPDQPYSVVVGMRAGTKKHIGHLSTARELAFHMENGGQPIFVVAEHEAGTNNGVDQAEKEADEILGYARLFGDLPDTQAVVVSDLHSDVMVEQSALAERLLTLADIRRIYGWTDEVTIERLRIPAKMVAAFTVGTVLKPDMPSVVLCDVNQFSHIAATKRVAKRLGAPMQDISFSARMLVPSLAGSSGRMTVNNKKTSIFMIDPASESGEKVLKAVSKGQPTAELQKELGGDPVNCPVARTALAIASAETAADVAAKCRGGGDCRSCKQRVASELGQLIERMPK